MAGFKTIGVIAKRRDARAGATLRELCALLRSLGRALLVEDATAEHYRLRGVTTVTLQGLAKRCDLVIVTGGDGTLLEAGRALAPQGVPILGVNQGRLGFMVDVKPEDMRSSLREILKGRFVREQRLLLSATIQRGKRKRGPLLAVNDVVIRNQAAVRMLEFETWYGRQFISRHRADGIIVSSPTGSTAYALSGGGPVLHPALDALSLVPICPHTLSDRPIVIGCEQPVRIVLAGAEGVRAMCTADGQVNEELIPGDIVEIRRARAALTLIHPANHDFFNTLRSKLNWGRGPDRS
ncbi:MAG: NAD(+) kinase [Pseudomonadota bacterium]